MVESLVGPEPIAALLSNYGVSDLVDPSEHEPRERADGRFLAWMPCSCVMPGTGSNDLRQGQETMSETVVIVIRGHRRRNASECGVLNLANVYRGHFSRAK